MCPISLLPKPLPVFMFAVCRLDLRKGLNRCEKCFEMCIAYGRVGPSWRDPVWLTGH